MDKFLSSFRTISVLGASAFLALACSKAEKSPEPDTTATAAVAAPPAEISIPGTRVFPESITSTANGSLYIGSVGQAQIYRVPPGATTAEVFIQPGTGGMKQIFGVLADEGSGTL